MFDQESEKADFRPRETAPDAHRPARRVSNRSQGLRASLLGHLPVMLAGGVLAAGVLAALSPTDAGRPGTAVQAMMQGSVIDTSTPAMAGGGVLLTSLLFIVLMLCGQSQHVRRQGLALSEQLAAGRSETRIGLQLLADAAMAILGALLLALLLVPALHLIVRPGQPAMASLGQTLLSALLLGSLALTAASIAIPAHLKRLAGHSAAPPKIKEIARVF